MAKPEKKHAFILCRSSYLLLTRGRRIHFIHVAIRLQGGLDAEGSASPAFFAALCRLIASAGQRRIFQVTIRDSAVTPLTNAPN